MMFSYSGSNDIIEIRIRDFTSKCIGKFKLNVNDKKSCAKLFFYLRKKYGIPSAEDAEEINFNELCTDVF